MKKYIFKFLFICLVCSMQKTFGWTVKLTNWTPYQVNTHVYWAGCKADHQYLNPGEVKHINAYACLLTEVAVDNGTSYTSSGQRTYEYFFIIGPVDGKYMAGRIEED